MLTHETAREAIDLFFDAYRRYTCTETKMFPELSPGDLSQEAYRSLEQELGVPLPWSFKEWHRRFHARGLQVQGTYLPLSPVDEPLQDLKDRILALDHLTEAIPLGVVPFGFDEITQSVVAFDTRSPADDDEWPVLFLKRGKGTGFDAAVIEHTSFPDLLEGLTRVIDGTMDPEEP